MRICKRSCMLVSLLVPISLVALVASFFSASPAAAGCAPDTLWMRTYGGDSDLLSAVHNTADGGFILGGTRFDYAVENADFWLIKTDEDGAVQWSRTYGTGDDEEVRDMRVVASGGYILAGSRRSWTPSYSCHSWVVRTNEDGDTLWTWSHGGDGDNEWAGSVQPLANGGFAVATTADMDSVQSDIVLYLLDSGGGLYDSGSFGDPDGDEGVAAIRQTSDGGLVMAGYTRSYGGPSTNVYVVKADGNCDILWEEWYGGSSSDQGRDLVETADGDLVIAGSTASYGAGNVDFYVIKTNSVGDTLWTRTVGGTEGDYADAVIEATDGTIVVVGDTQSFGVGEGSVYVAAIDGTGLVTCTATYGGSGDDVGAAVVEARDQGFVIVGGCEYAGSYDWSGLAIRLYGQAPIIYSIADVPYDQGGKVRLVWGRSSHDVAGGSPAITGYAIFRKYDWVGAGRPERGVGGEVPESAGAQERAAGEETLGPAYPPGDWDYVTTVPARCEEVYSTVVPTLCDSSVAYGVCWSFFFISAMTVEPGFYFDSQPDSGYSVDNLAPSPPASLHMPTETDLAWDEAPEEDFDYFTVYGSDVADFDEASFIGYTVEPGFDVSGHAYDYYHVTATDFAGNEGGPATVENASAGTPGDRPVAFALRQNEPNPFAASTVLAFDLPAASPVLLDVVDVKGRLVRTLVCRPMPAGRHAAAWDGCDEAGARVGPGVYFVRMTAGEFTAQRKMLRVR